MSEQPNGSPARHPRDTSGWPPPLPAGAGSAPQPTRSSPIPAYAPSLPGQTPGPQDEGPRRQARTGPPPFRYADWAERASATVVDWGLVVALIVWSGPVMDYSSTLDSLLGVTWLGLAGYFAWLNGSKGQSPGKALMGLKVVRDTDGSTLGGPVGLLRGLLLGLTVPLTAGILFVLALLWPTWDAKNRALHDKVTGAIVLGGYPSARFGLSIFRP